MIFQRPNSSGTQNEQFRSCDYRNIDLHNKYFIYLWKLKMKLTNIYMMKVSYDR